MRFPLVNSHNLLLIMSLIYFRLQQLIYAVIKIVPSNLNRRPSWEQYLELIKMGDPQTSWAVVVGPMFDECPIPITRVMLASTHRKLTPGIHAPTDSNEWSQSIQGDNMMRSCGLGEKNRFGSFQIHSFVPFWTRAWCEQVQNYSIERANVLVGDRVAKGSTLEWNNVGFEFEFEFDFDCMILNLVPTRN